MRAESTDRPAILVTGATGDLAECRQRFPIIRPFDAWLLANAGRLARAMASIPVPATTGAA